MKKILSAIAGLLLVASSASAFTASTYTKDIIPTNDATAAWKSFKWSWSGVDEIKVSVNLDETIDGFVSLRLASPKKGDIAKQFVLTNLGTTNAWIQFNGTNLPPNDTYWAQFMLEKTNAATASQFKTLANGKISVVYSIWQSTNWSSSTNAIVSPTFPTAMDRTVYDGNTNGIVDSSDDFITYTNGAGNLGGVTARIGTNEQFRVDVGTTNDTQNSRIGTNEGFRVAVGTTNDTSIARIGSNEVDIAAIEAVVIDTMNLGALTTNRQICVVTSDLSTITAIIDTTTFGEPLSIIWSNGIVDSYTMPRHIALTPGADPQTDAINWVYALPGTSIVASTTRPTTGPYSILNKIVCKDAGSTYSNANPEAVQRYTFLTDHQGKGRDSWQGEKIREAVGADLISGCEITTVTNASSTGVYVNVASGIIRQMHPQTWDFYSMTNITAGCGLVIGNGFDTADKFKRIYNLNELEGITTADGSTTALDANGERYGVQIYAIQSSGTSNMAPNCLMGLISDGVYSGGGADDQAKNDQSNFQVTTVPAAYKSMAVALGRLVIRRNGAVWTAVLYPPIGGGGSVGGSAATTGSSFSDSLFNISGTNNGVMKYSLPNLTADRTITMDNRDTRLASRTGTNAWTAAQRYEVSSVYGSQAGLTSTGGFFVVKTAGDTNGRIQIISGDGGGIAGIGVHKEMGVHSLGSAPLPNRFGYTIRLEDQFGFGIFALDPISLIAGTFPSKHWQWGSGVVHTNLDIGGGSSFITDFDANGQSIFGMKSYDTTGPSTNGGISTFSTWLSGDGGAEGILIEAGADVGINESNPQVSLHVSDVSTTVDELVSAFIVEADNTGAGADAGFGPKMRWFSESDDGGAPGVVAEIGAPLAGGAGANAYDASLVFMTRLGGDIDQKMILDKNGSLDLPFIMTSPTNYTAADTTLGAQLGGIDAALASAGGGGTNQWLLIATNVTFNLTSGVEKELGLAGALVDTYNGLDAANDRMMLRKMGRWRTEFRAWPLTAYGDGINYDLRAYHVTTSLTNQLAWIRKSGGTANDTSTLMGFANVNALTTNDSVYWTAEINAASEGIRASGPNATNAAWVVHYLGGQPE